MSFVGLLTNYQFSKNEVVLASLVNPVNHMLFAFLGFANYGHMKFLGLIPCLV